MSMPILLADILKMNVTTVIKIIKPNDVVFTVVISTLRGVEGGGARNCRRHLEYFRAFEASPSSCW